MDDKIFEFIVGDGADLKDIVRNELSDHINKIILDGLIRCWGEVEYTFVNHFIINDNKNFTINFIFSDMVIYMFKVDDDTFRMIIRYNISPNTRTELVIENIRILTDPDKIQALNNKDSKEDK